MAYNSFDLEKIRDRVKMGIAERMHNWFADNLKDRKSPESTWDLAGKILERTLF